jgi:hypothetical protein
MGLDIHAVSHLRYVGPIPDDDELERLQEQVSDADLEVAYFVLYPNAECFEAHLAGMEPGLYECTAASEHHEFRAGSYSYYNAWRENLCRLALDVEPDCVWEQPELYDGRPFFELINFSDADGRIGCELAEKLAEDFRDFAAEAEEFAARLDDEESFIQNYRDFAQAFELAARGGALEFC